MTEILEKLTSQGGLGGNNRQSTQSSQPQNTMGDYHTHNVRNLGGGGVMEQDYTSRPNLPNISEFKPTGTSNIFSPVIDIKTSSPRNNEKIC